MEWAQITLLPPPGGDLYQPKAELQRARDCPLYFSLQSREEAANVAHVASIDESESRFGSRSSRERIDIPGGHYAEAPSQTQRPFHRLSGTVRPRSRGSPYAPRGTANSSSFPQRRAGKALRARTSYSTVGPWRVTGRNQSSGNLSTTPVTMKPAVSQHCRPPGTGTCNPSDTGPSLRSQQAPLPVSL
ncbi:hypothetical protein SKAU_G00323890 [Synaphobranchus kaupii]|uniref:Uncharacterized protein n=1 Tax=Synaphobranchus kaupii TaxID=118154 RepID=A0A9Q1EP72_SYNKA|nr:hypothetical protein SKAU_G00323890 [Synaphobranchus kaupii]